MWKQHSPNDGGARRSGSRRFTLMHPRATLAIGVLCLTSAAGIAQTTVPGAQPPAGMLATSPLNPQSTRPVGIPLGSTEITTPGISPINPSQGNPSQGLAGCAESGNAAPGALFDGGGLSGGSSIACAGSTTAPSSPPSSSTVGRVGIPLGATELGGAGISPTVPVPGQTPSDSATSIVSPGNP